MCHAAARVGLSCILMCVLGGCVTDGGFATLSKGACSGFPHAEYQIHGADRYSQQWSDQTIEAEVVGCGFKRPKARPVAKPAVSKPDVSQRPKQTFKQRWLHKFFRDRAS